MSQGESQGAGCQSERETKGELSASPGLVQGQRCNASDSGSAVEAGFGQGKPLVGPRESGKLHKGLPHNCPAVNRQAVVTSDSDKRRPQALQVVGTAPEASTQATQQRRHASS